MTNKKTALIYIGQTPRPDITPEMKTYLDGICHVTEIGVLDPFTAEEIAEMAPRNKDKVLITKLRNGLSVFVDEDIIHRLMGETIEELQQGNYNACAVMCTGSFPKLPRLIPLVTSDDAFHRELDMGDTVRCIGVLVPAENQQKFFASLYQQKGKNVITNYASPYGAVETILEAAKKLKAEGADCICLDCMGYNGAIAQQVSAETGLPCYIPRKEIAKQISRLYQK